MMKFLFLSIILALSVLSLPAQTPDLELSAAATAANPPAFTNVSVSLTLSNQGAGAASDVKVAVPLFAGLIYQGGNEYSATQGVFNSFSHEWSAGAIPAGGNAVLTLNYFTLNADEKKVFAQVTAQTPGDADSSPGNNTASVPAEDDEALVVLNKAFCTLQYQIADLLCSDEKTPDNAADDTYTFQLTIRGKGPCGDAWAGPGNSMGAYNTAAVFGPYSIAEGVKELTFYDINDPGSVQIFAVTPPPACSAGNPERFAYSQLACGLSHPWEITYGPDDMLWVTESRGYRLVKINPADGSERVVIDLKGNKNFSIAQFPWPQGGFTGVALHPGLLSGKPYVYLAYTYKLEACLPNNLGCRFKTRVVRYQYDATTQTLAAPETLCDTIPGSDDHNGGRLSIGPVNGVPFLFYSVGDMGAGQFSNENRDHHGQNIHYYEGKILRFQLEPDQDTGAFDRWIPEDNPFNGTQQSAVWTYGHRNPQGIAFGEKGQMYAAEHGPYSDDEVNLIERGGNYGFPLVIGPADGNYNGISAGTGPSLPVIDDEAFNALALGAAYRNPIFSAFPASNDLVKSIYNNVKFNTPPFPNYFYSWPSMAPSGIEYYGSDSIPGWKNSLLLASLKRAKIFRLLLSPDGESVASDTMAYFDGWGRFRDLAVSPDGKTIFVACDSIGATSGPTQGSVLAPANRGCILSFRYEPVKNTVGVEPEPTLPGLEVSPNPAADLITIRLSTEEKPARLTLFNALGTPVFEAAGEGAATWIIPVEGWPPGSYQAVCTLESGKRVGKKIMVIR